MVAKGGAEGLAGERAALAGVEEDGALHTVAAADVLQHLDAQFRFHVVVHMEALDAAVKAVWHRRQVELPGRAWDLGDVGQEFFVGIWDCKIAVNEFFGLFWLSIGSEDAIGRRLGRRPATLPAYAVDPPDAVVVAILFICLQTFIDLLQQFPVPPTLFGPPEGTVVLLLADAQHPAPGRHRPTARWRG